MVLGKRTSGGLSTYRRPTGGPEYEESRGLGLKERYTPGTEGHLLVEPDFFAGV